MKTSVPKVSIYGFCGLAAYGVDQAMNYEFMIGLEGGVTSLVIAVPIAGLLCCISWPAAWRCLSRGDLLNALMLIGVFASLAAFSLGASINRAGEAYDRNIAATKSSNMPRLIAQQAMVDAKADWTAKDQVVQAEAANGGCGRICVAKKALAEEARQHYEAAKSKVAELGAARSADPMASRLAPLLRVPETWVQMVYPLMLPIGIWLASIAFIGIAADELNRTEPRSKKITKELPLSLQIATYMDKQERLDGQRPTQEEAARHFGISRSTISRQLARVG